MEAAVNLLPETLLTSRSQRKVEDEELPSLDGGNRWCAGHRLRRQHRDAGQLEDLYGKCRRDVRGTVEGEGISG